MSVKRLSPSNNIVNIPHMLRNLAAELESGETQMPMTLMIVAVNDLDLPPELYGFGQEIGRLAEIGAIQSVLTILAPSLERL